MYHCTCNSSWSFCCQALSTAQALISLKLLLINLGLINPGFLKIDFSPQDSHQRWWCQTVKIIPKKKKSLEWTNITNPNKPPAVFVLWSCCWCLYFYSSFGDHGFGLMIQLVVSHTGCFKAAAKKRIFHSLCPLEIPLHGSLSDIIFRKRSLRFFSSYV